MLLCCGVKNACSNLVCQSYKNSILFFIKLNSPLVVPATYAGGEVVEEDLISVKLPVILPVMLL